MTADPHADFADPDALTILRSTPNTRRRTPLLTKEYTVNAAGRVERREFGNATWFSAEAATARSIADLHQLLLRLEADARACIIRGAALAETDLASTRRKKAENGGAFADVPRSWIMLDADAIPLPAGASVLSEPEDVAQHLLELFSGFAPELEGASAIVQFSSSAGIAEMAAAERAAGLPDRWADLAKGDTVSAHIWFRLAEPLDGAALDRWAAGANHRAGIKAVDPATLRTVQPHYTAAPIFGAGLHDPLRGRRTLLVRGAVDAVRLSVPAEAPRGERTADNGTSANAGLGFRWHLEMIGDRVAGFHEPINAAIAAFVAANWPDPDVEALIELLQDRVERADPGNRSDAEIKRYAKRENLEARIKWVVDRQREKAEAAAAEREEADLIEPTFPDRAVPLEEGGRLAAKALEEFASRMREGETPRTLLRITVGGGKSDAAVKGAAMLLDAARAGGGDDADKKALIYAVPRHDLGGEIVDRVRAAHAGRAVATWRGMDADDPEAPGEKMCRDPELPQAAARAGLAPTEACGACPLRNECGYRRQRGQKADVWIVAHNMMFSAKPAAIPKPAVLVVDEAFWGAGLSGTDGPPKQLALSALADVRLDPLRGDDADRLFYLRRLAQRALEGHEEGGVRCDAFEAEGMTAEAADEWHRLEWMLQPKPDLAEGMDRAAILERLDDAAKHGFTRLRPALAKHVQQMLAGDAHRSVNLTFAPNADLGRGQGTGPAIRFAAREDFAKWTAGVPALFLDATTHPDVVRAWVPDLEVVEIEIAAPLQHVRQAADRKFGRASFVGAGGAGDEAPPRIKQLADLVTVELAAAGESDVLVIAQKAVKDLLAEELERRRGAPLPDRLHLAHHGAITGLDKWRNVVRLVVVGRPATNLDVGERLAEIVKGSPVERVQDRDRSMWPQAVAGIRRADGKGVRIEQDRHPDPLVEAVRWSITEGAILQAIGRGRGVRRTAPLVVTLLARVALPLTVAEITTWDNLVPDRVMLAAAEAALTGRALPLAPLDMVTARPDLWGSETAAKRSLRGEDGLKGPHPLWDSTHKGCGPFRPLRTARYRKPGACRWSKALVPAERGEAALRGLLGPLAAFELVVPEPAAERPARPAAPPSAPPPPPPPRPSPRSPAPELQPMAARGSGVEGSRFEVRAEPPQAAPRTRPTCPPETWPVRPQGRPLSGLAAIAAPNQRPVPLRGLGAGPGAARAPLRNIPAPVGSMSQPHC